MRLRSKRKARVGPAFVLPLNSERAQSETLVP